MEEWRRDQSSAAVERHQGRLVRTTDAELRTLKLLREVARPEAQAPGPLVQPLLVAVRVLGSKRAPASMAS